MQEIGVAAYLDRALAGAYRDKAETYRLGLAALDRAVNNVSAGSSRTASRRSRTT